MEEIFELNELVNFIEERRIKLGIQKTVFSKKINLASTVYCNFCSCKQKIAYKYFCPIAKTLHLSEDEAQEFYEIFNKTLVFQAKRDGLKKELDRYIHYLIYNDDIGRDPSIPDEIYDGREEFGKYFMKVCFMNSITPNKLQDLYDMSIDDINAILNGKVDPPSMIMLCRFCDIYNISQDCTEKLLNLAEKGRMNKELKLPDFVYKYLSSHPSALRALLKISEENIDDDAWLKVLKTF